MIQLFAELPECYFKGICNFMLVVRRMKAVQSKPRSCKKIFFLLFVESLYKFAKFCKREVK